MLDIKEVKGWKTQADTACAFRAARVFQPSMISFRTGFFRYFFLLFSRFCDFYKNLKFRKNPQKKNNYNIFKANALIYRSKCTCKNSCKNLPKLANLNFVENNTLCINEIFLAHRKIQYVNIFQYSVKSTSLTPLIRISGFSRSDFRAKGGTSNISLDAWFPVLKSLDLETFRETLAYPAFSAYL